MRVAVAAVVFLLEIFQQIFCEREVEFVSLAAVAEVDAAVVVRFSGQASSRKSLAAVFSSAANSSIQLRAGNFLGDAPEDRARIIFHYIAGENAERGERAGEGGDDDLRDAEGFGEGAGVQASGAAEGDEGEVARVAAAFDGDDADGFFHGGVDDADDSGGEFFERQVWSFASSASLA